MNPRKLLIVLGTRPEAIKLSPVINELQGTDAFTVKVIFTGQHRDLVRPIFQFFDIEPDYDLDIMIPNQDLSHITRSVLDKMPDIYEKEDPEALMVQGDTTSAYLAAHSGFYQQIPVIHLEAGLRSGRRYDPFPEEINRRLITQLTSLHLAATEFNRQTLLDENIPGDSIYVTGNPVIDALKSIQKELETSTSPPEVLESIDPDHRILLLTSHRRENWGKEQRNIFQSITEITEAFPDVEVIFPAHPNPVVMDAAQQMLGGRERIHVVGPMEYFDFLAVMNRSYLILTDSGGVQEEAPALGKPVLILRQTTERKEIIESGQGKLVGTDPNTIIKETEILLTQETAYQQMSYAQSPYGDGNAARQVYQVLRDVDFSTLA